MTFNDAKMVCALLISQTLIAAMPCQAIAGEDSASATGRDVLSRLPGSSTNTSGSGPGGGPSGELGADVTIAEIGNGINKYGTVDRMTGYSMTVVECNIGDEWAVNFSNTNQHILIGQNLYRIQASRFEQIGMSWVLHQWCAADFYQCLEGGSGNGTCAYMAIGIANVYHANLIGNQSDLGPRSEVNSSSGEYVYPYVLNWNLEGDDIYKRLQVSNSDLADSDGDDGATFYLAEMFVVTTDEPMNATGTHHNNASWRRMVRGDLVDGGYDLALSGSSHPAESAIEAWPQFDPSVVLSDVYVPEQGAPDGRLIVAERVADIGGGLWSYTYAIHNMNSHRSVRSVSIPIPDDATVEQVGFHDVDYHSGEPFDDADWIDTLTDGALTWATESFDDNEFANAIRFQTTYTYHFVSSGPPDNTLLSLALFRPGPGVDSLIISVQGPAPDCNGNNVADAVDIADGVVADVDENGIPDVCQALVATVAAEGSRSISASLLSGGEDPFAIRVTGDVGNPDVACVDAFVQSDGSLGATAVMHTLAEWGSSISIHGSQIIPTSSYSVSFEGTGLPSVSATTWNWGDANNDGIANFNDIQLTVLGFQGIFLVPLQALDIEPCDPNGVVNLADAFNVVFAFQGGIYTDTGCTVPCS